MTNADVFSEALKLIGETAPSDSDRYGILADRAPFLIASFANEVLPVDDAWRHANGMRRRRTRVWEECPLTARFPLSGPFFLPACLWLGGLFTEEDDPELSDRLFDRAFGLLSQLQDSLPGVIERIG